MSRRVLVGALLTLAAGGVAAGLALSTGPARAQGRPGVIVRGQFQSVGWGTSGNASIVREKSGEVVLRFDRSFHTQGAPDVWVYVGTFEGLHGVGDDWKLAGRLYRWWGRHRYPLGRKVPRGKWVVIFCGKCDRAFGAARLRAPGVKGPPPRLVISPVA